MNMVGNLVKDGLVQVDSEPEMGTVHVEVSLHVNALMKVPQCSWKGINSERESKKKLSNEFQCCRIITCVLPKGDDFDVEVPAGHHVVDNRVPVVPWVDAIGK